MMKLPALVSARYEKEDHAPKFMQAADPRVLRLSVKRGTSTPGYIAERACREKLLDLLSILPITR
jgi:hypothetical protein